MLPDRVSNPGPLTYESGALPIALRGPASFLYISIIRQNTYHIYSVIRQGFSLPKQSQRSRSILQDGSRSLRLVGRKKNNILYLNFTNNKIGICSNFEKGKLPPNKQ